MHRLQGDRQGRGDLERQVRGKRKGSPVIRHGILGVAAGAGTHDAVTRMEVVHGRADRHDLPGPLQPRDRVGPSGRAVRLPQGDGEIGAVEGGGPNPDEHLRGFRPRHVDLDEARPLRSDHDGLHPGLGWRDGAILGCSSVGRQELCGRAGQDEASIDVHRSLLPSPCLHSWAANPGRQRDHRRSVRGPPAAPPHPSSARSPSSARLSRAAPRPECPLVGRPRPRGGPSQRARRGASSAC